ncbi:MAG TPA: carboxypeptidase regulatory-like domain-containing protein, partial [Verrucomicrobiota bacterium]|nr:carboxypeptidase regulatory-like domain-containing protein [Verrucomicrobiota bacterium]
SGYKFEPPVVSVSLNSNINVNFTASGIYNISGKITKGGTPMQGVKVYAGIYSATTDNNGNFTIPNVSPKTYNVKPVFDGYAFDPPYYSIDVSRDYYGLEYIALNCFSLSGTVYNINPITLATNGIVSNLTINATNYYLSVTGQTNQTVITTTTDTNGTYVITNIIEGSITIRPETNKYLFYPLVTNIVLTSNTNKIDFLGSELFKVSGRIIFEDSGLNGVKVAAGGLTTTTSNDGYYEFTNLEATNIVIKPKLDGYRFVPSQTALIPNNSSTNIYFTAYGSLSISGVVMKDGIGLSGVYVVINQYLVQTLNDGFYQIDGLLPGNYQITPYLTDYIFSPQTVYLTLVNTNAIINFTAIPTYNVSGRVTDGSKGIYGATVSSGTISTLTDINGYFTLVGIPKGTNKIVVTLTGYLFSPIDVNVDSDMYGINIVATRLHNISGRILEGSRGVSGVAVSAGGVSTFSTSTGYYTLTNVPEGNVTIIPERDGYRFVPSNIVLNLTSDATNVNFLAFGTLSISGRVTDGINGISGIRINAYGLETVTDANGYYIISNLPPRSITVIPIDDNYLFIPGSTNITLMGKDVVDIDFIALRFSTISGQVLKSGNPEPDVKIQLSDGQEVLTDTNGQYVIAGLLPGSYTITASKMGHQFSPLGYMVSLPPDITNLNFTAYPLLMSAVITNNILVISVKAKPSCDYMIEATDSLTTSIWNSIVPFQTDTNGFIQLVIPTIDKTKPRFYRFRSL